VGQYSSAQVGQYSLSQPQNAFHDPVDDVKLKMPDPAAELRER
jgi:hypothetical protein